MEAVQPRRWTRQEYEQLAELGVLRPDERVELTIVLAGGDVAVPGTSGARLAVADLLP